MATSYIIGELAEGFEEPMFYAGHVEVKKFGLQVKLPAWTGEQSEAFSFATQEEAQTLADMFDDHNAVMGHNPGLRWAVYARP